MILLSAVLAVSAAAAPVEKPVKETTPSAVVSSLVRFAAPKNWNKEEYANGGGADPVVAFADGLDRISVRVFGAPGTAYKTPADFLAGPAASTMGRKPEAAGRVAVAGKTVPLYSHGVPVMVGDPHARTAGPPMLGREVFCVLPAANGRFVVLALSRETPTPDPDRKGEKAWSAFLKSVSLVPKPGR